MLFMNNCIFRRDPRVGGGSMSTAHHEDFCVVEWHEQQSCYEAMSKRAKTVTVFDASENLGRILLRLVNAVEKIARHLDSKNDR